MAGNPDVGPPPSHSPCGPFRRARFQPGFRFKRQSGAGSVDREVVRACVDVPVRHLFVQQVSAEFLMFMNDKTTQNKPPPSAPVEGTRLRATAPIHDWTRSTGRQEMYSTLVVLGRVKTRAQRPCRLLFRITFEEQTSDTSAHRFTAQQHVCSAKHKQNLVAY